MRAARRIVTVVLLVQVAWTVPLGVVLGVALDPAFLVAFGAAALAVVVVLLSFMLAWQRADARRDALLTHGIHVPARLVDSRPTHTRINNRRLLVHTFAARDNGIRATAKAFTRLELGTAATIAYDATDPAKATVVEDLDEVTGQLDWQALGDRRRRP